MRKENNQDGNSNNRSWNCGAEGPTDDGEITALRERQKRNLLATLFLAQGTQVTNLAALRAATIMPIVRTMKSAGSIGRQLTIEVRHSSILSGRSRSQRTVS